MHRFPLVLIAALLLDGALDTAVSPPVPSRAQVLRVDVPRASVVVIEAENVTAVWITEAP